MIEDRGVTQTSIAKGAGIDVAYLSGLLAGRRNFSRKVLRAVLDSIEATAEERDRAADIFAADLKSSPVPACAP